MVMKCCVMSCRVMSFDEFTLHFYAYAVDHRARPKSWSRRWRWRCDSPRNQRQGNRFRYLFSYSSLLISRALTQKRPMKKKTKRNSHSDVFCLFGWHFFLSLPFSLVLCFHSDLALSHAVLYFVIIYLSIHFSFCLFLEWKNKCWSALALRGLLPPTLEKQKHLSK